MKSLPLVLAASLVVLLSLQLQACSPGGFVRSDCKGNGRVYPVSPAQAWNITKAVFRWEGADAVILHRNQDYIVGTVGKGISDDAAICVRMDPLDGDNTLVMITSRHSDFARATTFTEASFYWRFSQAVSIVNDGKPLPVAPPE